MCDLHYTEADVFFVKLCDSVLDWVYKSTAVYLMGEGTSVAQEDNSQGLCMGVKL